MGSSSRAVQSGTELAPETLETLQAATRVLAGVALRGLDARGGTVTLPQFRTLSELVRIYRQLPPAGQAQLTGALRQHADAAGEGYGTISRGLVSV